MGIFGKIREYLTIENVTKKEASAVKKAITNIMLTQQYRQKEDIRKWRLALDAAESILNPRRGDLYRIYKDILLDTHLTSVIETRKNKVLGKEFKVVDKKGKIDEGKTKMLQKAWFKTFMNLALDSIFWGHSLVHFGDIIDDIFKEVDIVPRRHVVPEKHIIIKTTADIDGQDYTEIPFSYWLVEAGDRYDLGLLLKACPMVIFKKNALGSWSQFAELFGMPFRVGKTNTRDKQTRGEMINKLKNIGGAGWAVIDTDDELELLINNQSDAFQVYDILINRCNSEISKLILGQTMTTDDGSSRSQAEVHERVLDEYTKKDLSFITSLVQDKLFPMLNEHGFGFEELEFKFSNNEEEKEQQKWKNEQNKLIADTVKILNDAGIMVDPEWVKEKTTMEVLIPEEDETNPRLDVEYEAKANLRGSVGGVTGLLDLHRSVGEGVTDYTAAVYILRYVFGFEEAQAKEILGTPGKVIKSTPNNPNNPESADPKPSGGTDEGKSATASISITVGNLYRSIPTCGHTHTSDIKNEDGLFDEAAIIAILEKIYQGVINKKNLPTDVYTAIAEHLEKGLYKGFGKKLDNVDFDTEDYKMLKALRENIYVFSAAKTYQQVQEISKLIVGPDGKILTFAEFKPKALAIFNDYNKNYLETEYNAAVGQSQMASNWIQYKKAKKELPYLQYETVGDKRVRPTHRALDGITRKVDDPFWDSYMPLNGWGCRCTVRQLSIEDAVETDISKFKKPDDVPDLFLMNPGKDKYIFSPAHPYFSVEKGDKGLAKDNFNLPLPD